MRNELSELASAVAAMAAAIGGAPTGLTNNQIKQLFRCGTGTNSSVAATTTASTTILAANSSRVGGTIYHDDTALGSTMYLSLGATCTTTSYTIQLAPDEYYPIPFGYTGVITGVWSVATGNARVTELTP